MKLYRAFRLLALFASISLLFTSCGTLMQDGFSRQKYTGFKRGTGDGIVSHPVKKDGVSESRPEQGPVQESMSAHTARPENTDQRAGLTESLTTSPGRPDAVDKPEKKTPALVKKIKRKLDRHVPGKGQPNGEADLNTILLVLLCIFLPPIAILLTQGVGTPFWLDLIIWLLGFGAFGFPYLGILVLVAIIYAFIVCF
ncbi:MAG: YqaE/Pmp3 family membrane protein [Bacteroidota bacterium]